MATIPAVEMRDVTKRFGETLANDRVSIKVYPGTVHALLGELKSQVVV
ncbi:hypothetical protein GCM10010885_24750 [Alicyclobacillus cellulosilyticus]|uniref:Uncharacterized protein n=1 Tax=Alicyclobacillus cellulosilyticus TaxID=1003997 RepID=A0A917NNZ9_9BACL|nr:hypothetical protein [Alicyclobacillus cellulosilyticus]GGJ14546.1 hypothetical protein GCM10010885_24750 [Alicyclobacillus cellulosilyticus]